MWRSERRGGGSSPGWARELEALDGVLAAGQTTELGGEQARLARLVLAVRDDRPPLRRAFAAELDARLADGFPRRSIGAAAGGGHAAEQDSARRPEMRYWLGGLGVAATLAVVVALVAGGAVPAGRDGPAELGAGRHLPAPGLAPRGGSAPASGAGATSGAPAASGAARASGGLAQAPGGVAAGVVAPDAAPSAATGEARAVQRDAALALLAPSGHVQQVTDQAIAAVDRLGGIVESSSVALDDRGGSQASLELRVPGAALDRALAALSALAHVSSRSQSALDITDATAGARDRLAESRAERDALLRQLARATSPNQVASIHARLGLVAGRIAEDRTRLKALLGRASEARLSVTVGEDRQAAGAGGSGSGPAAALDDALGVLEAVFAALVIGLAGLVPVAALAALGWWACRPLRRRRREGALAGGALQDPA